MCKCAYVSGTVCLSVHAHMCLDERVCVCAFKTPCPCTGVNQVPLCIVEDALVENGPWPATIWFPYSPHICLSWLLERPIFSLRPPFLLPTACPPCFWDHLAGKKCRQLRKRHGKGAEQLWHRQLPGGLFLQLDLASLSLSVLHRHFFSFLKPLALECSEPGSNLPTLFSL